MKSASGDELETKLSEYSRLNHEFEMSDGYSYQSEITGVLKGLGFTEDEFSKPITALSGGQKTRVSLGKLLLTNQISCFWTSLPTSGYGVYRMVRNLSEKLQRCCDHRCP